MVKNIVISGGTEGLGKAIVKELSSDYNVFVLALKGKPLTELEDSSKEHKGKCYVCDISDWWQIEDAIQDIIKKHGRIDVLINNAGIYVNGELDDNDYERVKQVINVNVRGTIYLTKAVLPHMKEQKEGLIINIISQDGLRIKKERSVYTASKWALTGFTKALQEDVEKYGIRVCGLYPGLLKTGIFEKAKVTRNLDNALDPKTVAGVIRFIVSSPKQINFPELGIKNIDEDF